jgi:hypothetical protein
MDIYDALFRLGFIRWQESFEQAAGASTSLLDEIRIMLEGYMSFALQNPDLYQLCFERPVPGFVPSPESLELSLALLRQTYQRAAELTEHRKTDLPTEKMVDLIIAMMHGITAQHLSNEPQLPLGQGRFGSLIPTAVSVFERAWTKH